MTLESAPASGAKKRDYWWTVLFTDPVAVRIVRLLARRGWSSPDQVSIVAIILGLAVGPVMAIGSRAAFIVGGVIFYLAFMVDCVDGKYARALGNSSDRGAALDLLGDSARRASGSLGLIVGLWRWPEASDAAVVWAVVYVVLAYYFVELSGGSEVRQEAWFKAAPGASRTPGSRWSEALGKRRLLPTPGMPDVQAVVFIIGPITGFQIAALAVGAVMIALGILISIWRRLR